MELVQKLRQQLQANEEQLWCSFPDRTRRAKQTPGRMFIPSWFIIRLILLGGIFIVFITTSVIYHTDAFLTLGYAVIVVAALIVGLGLVLLRRHVRLMRLQHTIYAITTQRLLVLTLDRDQMVQNSYYPADLGRIDLIERRDGWGDIIIGGQQHLQSRGGFSLAVLSPRLSGVAKVREVASLLTRLKSEQIALGSQ